MSDSDKSLTTRHFSAPLRIDMRKEMDIHLFGGGREPIRGQWALVWIADPTKRVADFQRAGEQYPETKMKASELRSGFIHRELVTRVWVGFTGGQQQTVALGKINPTTTFIYTEHDVFDDQRIAELSEVWTLRLDVNGDPVKVVGEYARDIRWDIKQANPYREINGRTEFWRLHCERQDL